MSLCSNSHQKAASPASSCHLVCCSPDGPRRTAALTQNPYPSQSGGLPTRAARANTRGREDVFGPRVAGAGCGYGAGVLRRRMHPIASLPGPIALSCHYHHPFWQAGGVASYFDYSPISLMGAN